ncbi:MAG: ABC transporter ATP-binding protein [Clostridia bacterium]|nr:ABC transporter ATP-binding protein [Clostridia bacterium]
MEMQIREVEYEYRGRHQTVRAVRGATAAFETGKMYAIMGASGSGKTTLLSMLSGLIRPTAGEILLDGENMAAMDGGKLRREKISVIYQDFNLFPLLTVEENAAYSLMVQGQPKEEAFSKARKTLLTVGIQPEQFTRLPNTLSGGEQQRVAIARSLAGGSEIILADEPTGNLDEENSGNIIDMLSRLAHEEARCVIIVTHDPEVGKACDVVLHMRSGVLTEE